MAVAERAKRSCAKHPEGPRYANGSCAQCARARCRAYDQSEGGKAKQRARQKTWRAENREKVREQGRARQQAWRDSLTDEQRAVYRAKNAARRREWYESQDGRRKVKELSLRRNYGISFEEYERMAAAQNGCCGICECELDLGFSTAVDHCHETGAVRGLLCSTCNMSLGGFRDSAKALLRAVAYLERKLPWQ